MVTENTRLCTRLWQLQKFRFILKFVLHFLCIGTISKHDTKPWIQDRHPMGKIDCVKTQIRICCIYCAWEPQWSDGWSSGRVIKTHWGRVTHTCVGNLTFIGPDNGLAPGRRQAIIWSNARILLIGPWGANFSEILIGIQAFSVTKMHLKMSSAKGRPFCVGLNVLNRHFGEPELRHGSQA